MDTGRRTARVPERENGPITLLEEKVWSVKSESRVADKKGLSDSQDGNDDQDHQMHLDLPKANMTSADCYGW